jgi:hypothetical protein
LYLSLVAQSHASAAYAVMVVKTSTSLAVGDKHVLLSNPPPSITPMI